MKVNIVISCLLVMLSISAFSQSESQLWTGVGISHKLSDLEILVDHQIRYGVTTEWSEKQFTNVGLEYDFDIVNLGGEYRFGKDRRNNGDLISFGRLSYYAKTKIEFNRFEFKPRLQWQRQLSTPKKKERVTDKIRLKGQIDYNIRKWKLDPSFAAEFFTRNDGDGYFNEKMRFTLGTTYEIVKDLYLSAAYRFEPSFTIIDEDLEADLNILQVLLDYKF